MTTVKMVKLGTLIKPAKLQKCGNDDYPVLSMTMHNGLVFQSDKFKKSVASQDKSTYKVVHRNQLVIGFPIDEGVLATQRITDAGIVSPAYGIWDVDQTKIIPEFLEYALRCNRAIDYYKAKLRGSTARRRSLPTPTLLELDVPLPDIEQQRLALTTIRHAKNALDSRQAQLTKLDELIKARFVEMFGDILINSMGWTEAEIGVHCFVTKLAGFEYTQYIQYENFGEVVMVKAQNIKNGKLNDKDLSYISAEVSELLPRSQLMPGDVVMTYVGANIGDVAVIDNKYKYHLAPNVAKIRPDSSVYNSVFLMKLLMYMKLYIVKNSADTAKAALGMSRIRKLKAIVPPLSLQNDFATFVECVDQQKQNVQQSLEKLELLKKALMQEYFG